MTDYPFSDGTRRILPEPGRYILRVDGHVWIRGTLQDVQARVAELVTTRLAADPYNLAPDAAELNHQFSSGTVQKELDNHAIWYTILGAHTDNPIRIEITDQEA